MDLHLFTTDVSAFSLLTHLAGNDRVTCIIVPENRMASDKVRRVRTRARVPVQIHRRNSLLNADLPPAQAAVSWFYSQIIAAPDLARYPLGILNMHGGRIPEYRGANVLNWAIANGERDIGVIWHLLVPEVDAGPIYAEDTVSIADTETAWDARAKIMDAGMRLFPQAWRQLRLGLPPLRLPDLAKGRIWPPRRPEHGRIEPGWPEWRLRAMIRAQCPPWPPAFLLDRGSRIEVTGISDQEMPDTVPYRTAEGKRLYLYTQSATR